MVVDSDRKDLLRVLLSDHIVVQELEDLTRLGQLVERHLARLGELLCDDVVAQVDAFVTYIDARTCDQLLDLLLRFAAETTFDEVSTVAELRH